VSDAATPLRLPEWARKAGPLARGSRPVRLLLREQALHTVCEEARCPNLGECFARGTATFMLLGDRCTRRCGYCAVSTARPLPADPGEPSRVAAAASRMGLRYVVLTSVDRDDLPDGGAAHFAAVIAELKKLEPRPTVEVLTPDFRGDMGAVDVVLAAAPDVYNHNVETVRRLYPLVRRQGRYDWAFEVIGHVARHGNGPVTKSGLMVGLGEQRHELEETLRDLASVRCQVVTIGQYLRPTSKEVPVVRYWSPQEFAALERFGRSLGLEVIAGPFVRSSYHAEEAFLRVSGGGSAAADE